MITRFAPISRSKGMENMAFSNVVRDWHSRRITEAGTPLDSSLCWLVKSSPRPQTMIFRDSPAWYNSAARIGRTAGPPPSTTMTSALTGPESTKSSSCGNRQPAKTSKPDNSNRTKHHFHQRRQRIPSFNQDSLWLVFDRRRRRNSTALNTFNIS